ncbi:hypothetical protein GCM10010218_19740 [Streptomyces mashuensis]|uniref:Uncharacterized protein n=1 Tax=Streptomyces mashuensis TaxID=33904 RepID=A0A919B1D7_9ACTN|nr:hypothetical protein [Streptomyces mashuensis]GHF38614.1 hypothetical protein GCM10010218_19740 [Streptomyces mashuensis]
MGARARVELNTTWERELLRSHGVRNAVTLHTETVKTVAQGLAPRGSRTKNNWNAIRNNLAAVVALDATGWRGNVVVEEDRRVFHALWHDLDGGWKDRKGGRHRGNRFLKRALERARDE